MPSLCELIAINERAYTGMRPPAPPYHVDAGLTDHDLAHLADWATDCKDGTPNPSWKRAYALIREGADMLLRRRAMSAAIPETI